MLAPTREDKLSSRDSLPALPISFVASPSQALTVNLGQLAVPCVATGLRNMKWYVTESQ